MKLVLVESPTKARTLTKFLGGDYRVEATMGHLRDLPKNRMGFSVKSENGKTKFLPDYEVAAEKKSKVADLVAASRGMDRIILATDPDREGEAIAWHVAALLRGTQNSKFKIQNFQRVVFHQITKDAILDAMKHPRELDMNLVDAQQARRILDRMVGYQLSPLLWRKIRRGLSAGRVQSVAVRMIVEREREIESFMPVEYWEVFVKVQESTKMYKNVQEGEFDVKLIEIDGNKADLSKKNQVDPVVEDLKKARYSVEKVDRTEVRKRPFPPFTTSTLQQAASRTFRWSGKKTMNIAQRLYEHGFITYHRTDSTNLAKEAVENVRQLILSKYGKDYLPSEARFFKTKNALAQEAHEAIRPTNPIDFYNPGKLEQEVGLIAKDAFRLYQLIWKKFVSCQMADQIYDQTTIKVLAQGIKKYGLKVVGMVEKFEGWKILYQSSVLGSRLSDKSQSVIGLSVSGVEKLKTGKPETENGEQKTDQPLPEVQVGDQLQCIKVDPQQNFTQPPGRFTEAMLIKLLEEKGIGRPSTYAPIVSTIQDRGYVEKMEGRFHPMPVGIVVNDFLVEYFSSIVDYDFTKNLEEDFDKIAENKKGWNDVLGEFYSPFVERLKKVEIGAERKRIPAEETGESCPKCGEGRQVIRSGKFGKFLSCSLFPKCDWKNKYVEKSGVKCPLCRDGDVVVKKTKKGRHFFGCSNYPNCKFASWRKPGGELAKKQEI
ncbi:type I DNA topoisomerase [Candidatus Collierbacteria bacterium]|nr:type I DNA topoisomerase [Candidatus Collierbacteria bacterium]